MRIKKIISVGIVLNNEDKILVTRRVDPQIPAAHLKWDVPGGKNEENETLKETLIREVEEETGLKVSVVEAVYEPQKVVWEHADYTQDTIVHCFLCKFIGGSFSLEDPKVDKLKWVSFEEVLALDLLFTTRRFIDSFLENRKQ